MLILGECIHVIATDIRKAIESRDKAFIQDLAKRQADKGADIIDLNVGPQKKAGAEVMPWMVETIQEVTDLPLSLDTTNSVAIEAGLKVCKNKAIINSTDATEERLTALMPLAAKYNCDIIALSLAKVGLPTTADARIELAAEILAVAEAEGVPSDHIWLDPLVLTINGNQEQAIQTIEAVRFFKQMADPAPMTTCGLSNVSNSCPEDLRPLLNRVFMVMMAGAGLDSCIADPLDDKLMEVVKILADRDNSTAKSKVYLDLYDCYQAGEMYDTASADMSDPEISDIVKTVRALQNESLYAHGYLRL